MATEYPAMECYGVDISPIFPSEIKPPNTFFQLANVLEGLPFPENWFSFVQQRLFMPALRTYEWLPVLTDIYRVIKPGGFVQLLESDPTIYKLPLEKQEFWLKCRFEATLFYIRHCNRLNQDFLIVLYIQGWNTARVNKRITP